MRALIDAHAFLWFAAGDARLSISARHAIEDAEANVFLSIASAWEIAIKVSTGKLLLGTPFNIVIADFLRSNVIALLELPSIISPTDDIAVPPPRSV